MAVGRRSLVTAGTGHVIHTTRNEPIVRFNTEHTRNGNTTCCNTHTTVVNNTSNASYVLATGSFNIGTDNAVTRD